MGNIRAREECITSTHFTDAIRKEIRRSVQKIRVVTDNKFCAGYFTFATGDGVILCGSAMQTDNLDVIERCRLESEKFVLSLAAHSVSNMWQYVLGAIKFPYQSEVGLILSFAGNSTPETDLAMVLASAVALDFLAVKAARETLSEHNVQKLFESVLTRK